MGWIAKYIILVSLISSRVLVVEGGRPDREGERANSYKANGSYKILNRLVNVKPFIHKRVENMFVFPGLTSRSGVTDAAIPENCKKMGICDDIPNYPEELAAKLIQQLTANSTRFNKDILEAPQIAQRIGPDEEIIDLCTTEERLYSPRVAQDSNRQWHYILNDKKNPQQTFRVEVCKETNSPCSSIAYFQNGYESQCVQKYMLRRMIAIGSNNEAIEKPLQVPSCCACVARQT